MREVPTCLLDTATAGGCAALHGVLVARRQ